MSPIPTMFVSRSSAFLVILVLYRSAAAVNTSDPEPGGGGGDGVLEGPVHPQSPGVESPSLGSYFSLNLETQSFPEDLEISNYCVQLLRVFGERYVAYVNCSVSSARPVKVCQNCFVRYDNLKEIYSNISSDQTGPGNASCRDSLLRSDRLMLVYMLYNNLEIIWTTSGCDRCVDLTNHSLKEDTLNFMVFLNLSLSCFEKYQQNQSELCIQCKDPYRNLSQLYAGMEKNKTLCIDLEDSMNMTRKLWSKNFNCSFPREETVPVIAVSSFMLFLPVIFYLSSFLHSEQKKRKLIHPKRAKSNTSLMNIQDKFS